MQLLALAVTALALIALLAAERRGSRLGVWIAKPIASLGFVWIGLAAGALDHMYGRWIFAGLVLGAIGDVLLIEARTFVLGLASFLLGHVAYAIAFAAAGSAYAASALALIPLGLVALLIGRWLLPHVPRKMKVPVIAYTVVITAMVAFAAGAYATPKRALILAGATAFFLSDISVARNKFVKPGFDNKLWGLPLYYGAQVVLALSAAA